MTTIQIDKQVLEDWFHELDGSGNPARSCFNVAESIYDVLQQAKVVKPKVDVPSVGLTFNQIKIGVRYRFRNTNTIRPLFRGVEIEITKKNRTRVVGKLVNAIQGYPAGTSINMYPENLEEI